MNTPIDDADQILRTVAGGDRERLARIALAMIPAKADQPMLSPEAGTAEARLGELLATDPHRLDAGHFHAVLTATDDHDLDVLVPGDGLWPTCLTQLHDAQPVALWARGNTDLLTQVIATRIVLTGSRAASHYGERVASDIAHDLAKSGYVVTTGGQFGIDAAALRAATGAEAPSIAVLPSGLGQLHPRAHGQLFDRVVGSGGLLLTEAPPDARATRTAHVQRGRIMAALAGTTVVVEAALRSGALPIAQQAIALWRIVGAVPGPVTSATSAGCHRLIRDGDTHMVTCADDIIDLIDDPKS